MAAAGQWHSFIKMRACIGNDFCTADRVITTCAGCAIIFTNRICAIKCVIQATPTGIGCVQGVASIQNGHNKLRSSDCCNLRICICCGDFKIITFFDQITDLTQESGVSVSVKVTAAMIDQPCINRFLQIFTLLE